MAGVARTADVTDVPDFTDTGAPLAGAPFTSKVWASETTDLLSGRPLGDAATEAEGTGDGPGDAVGRGAREGDGGGEADAAADGPPATVGPPPMMTPPDVPIDRETQTGSATFPARSVARTHSSWRPVLSSPPCPASGVGAMDPGPASISGAGSHAGPASPQQRSQPSARTAQA